MTEDTEIAGTEHDAQAEREPSWRAKSVGLVAVDMDDAELLHGWRSDLVSAYEFGIWPRSLTAMRERIERDSDDDDRGDFLVLLPDSTPIGHIALTGQNVVNGTAQVELMLAAQHRGHGHGTDDLDALVDLAFGELPLYRLTAETHTDDAPAHAVLAKSGFVHEGTSRVACLHRGHRLDLAVFSLLRPEWEELSSPRAWDA
jgi:RimJ/RimL family protein N-acetyltransferase